MKKCRKTLTFCLIVLFSLLVVFSCKKGGDSTKKSTLTRDQPGYKEDTSPVTLNWYIHYSWFPTVVWGEDMVSRQITEQTGVSVNFVVPAGNEAEKLNTLIASGTLPDLITLGFWETQIKDMIEGDLVWPLDELAEMYDPYFFKVTSEAKLNWFRQDDGHVYGYPNTSYTQDDYDKYTLDSAQTFVVKKDMYEAIGSPPMRTPEEFLAALQKAKEMFPTVGSAPLIPLGITEFGTSASTFSMTNYSFEQYIMDFLAIPREKNGKFYDGHLDPEYIRWLKTFRKANEMGLIAKDIFVDKRAQMEEKIAQGRYFAMLYQRTDFANPQLALFAKDPNSVYMAIDGPANSNMDDPTLAGSGISGWTVTLISKKCKNPERAIRLMSYLISEEGNITTYLGVKDKMWHVNDEGKKRWLPEPKKVRDTDRTTWDKTYGGDFKYWMLMDTAMMQDWKPRPVPPFKQMEEWTYPYATFFSMYDNIDPLPTDPEGVIKAKHDALYAKVLPKLILAETEAEFDDIWAKYLEDREKMDVQKLMDYRTVKMLENKKKLGM